MFARCASAYPKAFLELAGEGDERSRLAARVERHGVKQQVRMPGRIPAQDLYAASDLFALASWNEGLANAALEAGAAGLPLVVSDAGGLPEIVADGVNGVVVRKGDIAGFAVAIARYLADPDLRHRSGAAGAARVAERFAASMMAHKMERLFLDLLAQ